MRLQVRCGEVFRQGFYENQRKKPHSFSRTSY